MTDTEQSRIDRTIEVNAPPERVWRILTTAKDLGTWLQMNVDGEIAEGADVWMTNTNPAYAGMHCVMRDEALTPPPRFAGPWAPSEVALRSIGGGKG